MNIYISPPEQIRTYLDLMMRSQWLMLEYVIDNSAPPSEGQTHSLEARLTTEQGQFAFYGKAFRKLPRFDLPQVTIDQLDTIDDRWMNQVVKIDLASRSVKSAALLWTAEEYAGRSGTFSSDDKIIYTSGVIFDFADLTSLIISASQFEPDILIISDPAAIEKHIAKLHHVEYLP